ncbi:GGDEF domain-containing protein [Pollutimonas subterranea]|uniref:GGDEF domain-containing protein n=1 Tax=Pollutimonas subterranea TaxID=2045210 RepID=UPI00130403B4|nr:sensor domain-containing diguanylate cyclase [Pollutimonas subterranea]
MDSVNHFQHVDSAVNDRRRLRALASYRILDTEYEEAFHELVLLAATICDAPIAVINFIDQERQWFKAEIGLGIRETAIDISICQHGLVEHDILVIEDTQADCRTSSNPLVSSGDKDLRFYAGALLKSGPHVLGTLCVLDYRPRTLTEKQVESLDLLRRQVMRLLETRRLQFTQREAIQELDLMRRDLHSHAYQDHLTGLLNRRAFEKRLELEIESVTSAALPSMLLMLDLNDFKNVNDTRGHKFGDAILKAAALNLRDATRSADVLARWGGDEFLILLPSTDEHVAQQIAQRLKQALKNLRVAEESIDLSAGLGIVQVSHFSSVEELMQDVDVAMYTDKRKNKDRSALIGRHNVRENLGVLASGPEKSIF